MSGRFFAAAVCTGMVVLLTVPTSSQLAVLQPGDPLPGVTPVEFEEFRLGLIDFTEVETADDGLGPAFNATGCSACHNLPAIGGISPMTELRAGRRDADGTFHALDAQGSTGVQSFSLPNHLCQPALPDDANVVARRMPLPLFGAGLVEAIPDDTVLALEDVFDRNRDGITGRASLVVDPVTRERRVGRFGWKAQFATLLSFSAGAYRDEMGITNEFFPSEAAYGIDREQLKRCDLTADPEDRADPATGRRGVDNFASFMRLLAPLARAVATDVSREGDRVFNAIGCAACHVPILTTGPSSNPLFNRRNVALFSDLLLHRIGTGDGIVQSDSTATGDEIRTPALWGLRLRRPFLHDGSAATIEDAIGRHRGEAESARHGFFTLDDRSREALLAFVRSI
jgi:CxxC motif-containing protein (DUF1111 family)